MPERTVPHPTAFRLVLWPLAAVQLIDGVWALFFPRSFYDDFPAGRGGWVAALPEYSEHLVRDVGALFLATALLLAVAAVRLERRLVTLTLVVWLLWALPHAVWHFFNLGAYETGDAVANAVSLALTVAGPAALLVLLARTPTLARRGAGAAPAGGATRLSGVERPRNPLVRAVYGQTKRQFGRVMEPIKLTAHSTPLLLGYGAFEMATERATRMDGRLKELATMKAAQLSGCEWCLDFGSAIVRAKGVSDEDLRALLDPRDSDVLSDDDKLVVEYAEAMTRTPVDVPDELFERLRARFDEAQIVELTSVIALENYRARFNWALGIQSEGFSEGAYCVPPALAAGTTASGA
ncbi:MAG TPA: carboxymuconolactone decarboxylase family protein [Solirubrobacteraceae bacterium]|nr:carboxymuconolactone decarboxylase family protein [Solirubrobacteraceae bacterium]